MYPSPHQPRRYTEIHYERVETKAELLQLLIEGWWFEDLFWVDAYQDSSPLFIHCATNTKKLIREAKRIACQLLEEELLVEDELVSDGKAILRLRHEDDDLLIV